MTKINSLRTPWVRTTDVRMRKFFTAYGTRLGLILEVYNLFDRQNVIGYDEGGVLMPIATGSATATALRPAGWRTMAVLPIHTRAHLPGKSAAVYASVSRWNSRAMQPLKRESNFAVAANSGDGFSPLSDYLTERTWMDRLFRIESSSSKENGMIDFKTNAKQRRFFGLELRQWRSCSSSDWL
jgi:hypothetical protein